MSQSWNFHLVSHTYSQLVVICRHMGNCLQQLIWLHQCMAFNWLHNWSQSYSKDHIFAYFTFKFINGPIKPGFTFNLQILWNDLNCLFGCRAYLIRIFCFYFKLAFDWNIEFAKFVWKIVFFQDALNWMGISTQFNECYWSDYFHHVFVLACHFEKWHGVSLVIALVFAKIGSIHSALTYSAKRSIFKKNNNSSIIFRIYWIKTWFCVTKGLYSIEPS